MSSRVDLPWSNPPLTGNRTRGNPHARAAEVKRAKEEARGAIRQAFHTGQLVPMFGANVFIHLRPATKRRRDADNLAPTLKVCQDALVLEGILPDDSWVSVPRSGHHIHPPEPGQPAAMWLELTNPDQEQP